MQKEPNVKNKEDKGKETLLLPTVWKSSLGGNTSIPEPRHPGPTCLYSHHRFHVSELTIDVLLQHTSSVFCSESMGCEPWPSDKGPFVVIKTTSKHLGSVVSVPPLFSQWRRVGGAFIVSVTSLRPLARLFLS